MGTQQQPRENRLSRPRGAWPRAWAVLPIIGGLVVCVGTADAAAKADSPPGLVVYSGGHVKPVLQRLVDAFAKATGVRVAYESGPSGKMRDEALKKGADLYIAADLRHLRYLEGRNLVAAKMPLAHHRLAIVVKRSNPKGIATPADLARPGVRVYVEGLEGCQVGKATRRLLTLNEIAHNRPTVTLDGEPPSLRNAGDFIKAGLLDAAVVWDSAAARMKDDLDVIAIPADQNVAVNIVAVLLRSARHSAAAERFIAFLTNETSHAVWAKHGFRPGPCPPPATKPEKEEDPKQSAERMIRASRDLLAPVYAPLAEQIVADLGLAGREGIGIDLGSGPGDLIIELCKRTRLHWINADINPHFFGHFYRLAAVYEVAPRVSAVCADAQTMPFRDNYADVIVSRGSYHFWPDRAKGFSEIYRVLKPGGAAYIGRGFSQNLPVETARAIRERQGKRMRYDPAKEADNLRTMLDRLGIKDARIHLPKPPGGEDVNYGVWVEFHKPEAVRN